MPHPWLASLGRTLGLILIFALIGWVDGHIVVALLIATTGCLVWHLYHLYRLDHWLRNGSPFRPPTAHPFQSEGIWKEIYGQCFRLRRRSRKRKRKVRRVIRQFRSAAAALPDAIVVLREDDTVLWCNEVAQNTLGLRSPQDVGLQLTTLVRHPIFVSFLAKWRDIDNHNGNKSVAFPAPLDANQMLNVRIVPYGKKKRLLVATDISRLHRLEQIRQDFVANVSHELRTPLTVINGYLETLLDSNMLYAEQCRSPLKRMQEQSYRMARLIEDLLMLSRLETQQVRSPRRPIDVPTLLANIAEDAISLSGERTHKIEMIVDSTLWIHGGEQELRSAFSNLVFNAVRYTPAKGKIIIRWFATEDSLRMEVEDDGEGIPPHHLERITERFYRVGRDRGRDKGGTGLGLAIVKHVMKNHEGKLQITSEVGTGSLFVCQFPNTLKIMSETLPADISSEA
jgi:two-component system phosphate regulon sensor histidine kinase PhoR